MIRRTVCGVFFTGEHALLSGKKELLFIPIHLILAKRSRSSAKVKIILSIYVYTKRQ